MEVRKILLRTLNPHISCKICKGYLVDATTVTECLHTFCKSCLVTHLEKFNTCPTCEIVIHVSHPLNYISYDRTMQDIVNYLCPNLQTDEMKREEEFYRQKKIPNPKLLLANGNENGHGNHAGDNKHLIKTENNGVHHSNNHGNDSRSNNHRSHPYSSPHTRPAMNGADYYSRCRTDYHRTDDQVNIMLESHPRSSLQVLKRKYIRCSVNTTVTHIKKFVAKKLFNDFERYREIDILCNEKPVRGIEHTLKFVLVTLWANKEPPLKLQYKESVEPDTRHLNLFTS